jgi:Maltokinase N-terminal cap domain
MAVVHKTTMSPGKLELLAAWLPAQSWYLAAGEKPILARAGGFRLDDPAGQVGIEFMAVTSRPEGRAVTYLVPMTYRGSALASANGGLIGTSQHGVLGRRWIYDGIRDPVLVAQLVALIQGEVKAQMQDVSNTPDPTVTGQPVTQGTLTVTEPVVAVNGPSGSDLRIRTDDGGTSNGQLAIHLNRILQPSAAVSGQTGQPCLCGTWQLPGGRVIRGILATAEYTSPPAVQP